MEILTKNISWQPRANGHRGKRKLPFFVGLSVINDRFPFFIPFVKQPSSLPVALLQA